jgi:hypothetical protein
MAYRALQREPGGANPIRRRWRTTLLALAVGAIIAGAAVLLEVFVISSLVGHLFALVLLGLGLLFASVAATAGVGECPRCGESLSVSLSTRERDPGLVCPGCQRFLEGDGRVLRETAADTVAARPVFGVVLGDRAVMPDRCCICGEASTRVLPARTLDGRASVEVPHCDAHEGGAWLRKEGERLVMRFRSLAFAAALLEQNGLEPHGTNTSRVATTPLPRDSTAAARAEGRWFYFAAALFFWALAALSYAAISDDGIIELGDGMRASNFVLLVAYRLLGKKLIAVGEIGLGALFFLGFVESFRKPKGDEARSGEGGSSDAGVEKEKEKE